MNESKMIDWLGVCLEIMAEYIPIDVRTGSDSKKYWETNAHLLCLMEYAEIINSPNNDRVQNRRNSVIRDFLPYFASAVRNSMKEDGSNGDESEVDSNSVINNLLLISLMDD
jgi:hypothetical protein